MMSILCFRIPKNSIISKQQTGAKFVSLNR